MVLMFFAVAIAGWAGLAAVLFRLRETQTLPPRILPLAGGVLMTCLGASALGLVATGVAASGPWPVYIAYWASVNLGCLLVVIAIAFVVVAPARRSKGWLQ